MEQILNKLSEIETVARRVMEDAEQTRTALSQEMEDQCKAFDDRLEQETNKKIQELKNSLEQKKDAELTALRRQMDQSLADLDAYYSANHEKLADSLFRKLLEH